MGIVHLTDENFRQSYSSTDIVVIDFWAGWCMPCRQFAPTFEECSGLYPEALFGKVDVEAEQQLAAYFSIRGIPTILIIRSGIEVYRSSGVLGLEELKSVIDKVKTLDMEEIEKQIDEEESKDT